ncbi:hypothetical protein [Cupriavidus nantongensis]|uniref:Uncharacterized protein n=1 Tax=Cupriavidus nantongensis TaxID=1796606 RepID=A0A142JGS5_9BURK|nr:hypothetical protein [Cupriavidus nantongensis]AMR77287.1 hypothetical protein A2G96_05825 [Cupriavidus nantongensis]
MKFIFCPSTDESAAQLLAAVRQLASGAYHYVASDGTAQRVPIVESWEQLADGTMHVEIDDLIVDQVEPLRELLELVEPVTLH